MRKWKRVSETFESPQNTAPNSKLDVVGPGSFRDPRGNPDISSETIVYPWRATLPKSLIGFTVLWNLIANVGTLGLLTKDRIKVDGTWYDGFEQAFQHHHEVLLIFIFPAVGLGLLYYVLACMMNETRITLHHPVIRISRGPLPWTKMQRTYNSASILQVFIEEYSSHTSNNRPVRAFRVKALVNDGPDVIIESGMTNYSDARILEQWLETRLKIEDRPVPGEAF